MGGVVQRTRISTVSAAIGFCRQSPVQLTRWWCHGVIRLGIKSCHGKETCSAILKPPALHNQGNSSAGSVLSLISIDGSVRAVGGGVEVSGTR